MTASERARGSADPPGSSPNPSEHGRRQQPGPGTLSPRDAILQVVKEVLVPLVHADGGEIYIVSADDLGVSLHLSGRYSGCPGNTLARRKVIEPLIATRVPGATVSVTSGALIPPGAKRL